MSHIEVDDLTYVLPDGRLLLNEVSFKVGEGVKAALAGPNGGGKTTLLRLIAGELRPSAGRVRSTGGIGVMRQFLDAGSVGDLLLSVAPPALRTAVASVRRTEAALGDDEKSQLAYAQALSDHADAGGYELEVVWDVCTTAAFGLPYLSARERDVRTLSGGEQKRLMLHALLRGPDGVLLLDEPDNYLDLPGKQWLEDELRASPKTVLLVSHDRRLLAEVADRIITVEARGVWVHGGGYTGYPQARRDRAARLDERRRRWEEERARLRGAVHTLRQRATHNDALAGAYQAAMTRLTRYEEAGPPERPPKEQNIRMRLRGGRTGKRALTVRDLALPGLVRAFSTEIWYGERIGILGLNGTGKSHFLRLLAGEPIAHTGTFDWGARVRPGWFAQTHLRPDLHGRPIAELIIATYGLERNDAMAALARYELAPAGGQHFETLSGGQQARLQILLLELSGATLLLLDEPTDNLDLASAEALQRGLSAYEGTVLAVTHDRWFAADFDRHLTFTATGHVHDSPNPNTPS
ncbi:ABC-F family ATP-binding cassette domain-containing protein [Nonomuraea endophytica]|uniref:ATPase subunit of ABC transporter with duplicated ATPase domains n=1 Tax=Nonomuraea endophytica TaxID=714136 RepID=A0A7W8A3G2_9ACTN|nr:ATP-binding cassette domain-containing protein [Nonomuraea endophytica]MBB5078036.1 ATPase subunit of ABC transporter with duplicated ATPase domains [Nonomuraea endophytica]